jgi:hypothetical protein
VEITCAALGLGVFIAAAADILPDGELWLRQVVGPVNFAGGLLFFAFAVAAGLGLLGGARVAASAEEGRSAVRRVCGGARRG